MTRIAALLASATLSAMLFAVRLPPGPEFFLPRRAGYGLFAAAWRLFSWEHGRRLYSGAVFCALAVAAGMYLVDVIRSMGKSPLKPAALARTAAGALTAAALVTLCLPGALDVIMFRWFPYGSMNAWEPVVSFLVFAAIFVPFAHASRESAAGRLPRAGAWLGVLAVLAAAGIAVGVDAARPLAPPAAKGRTEFVVLTEGPDGPGTQAYALPPDVFADADARPYLRAAAAVQNARTLPALRALYEEDTKRWDVAGLRGSLLLGVARGDGLARSLLLQHLTAAPPSAEARAALGALADEDAWRVGPLGAAALAKACARQGDKAGAARWAAKSEAAGGAPAGLLGLEEAEAPAKGRISGVLRAPSRARVALYLKKDPAAPYLLDAAGLVAAADPDAKGRFAFSGLPPGRYYLAVAFSGAGPRGKVSASGWRGDVVLTASRPSAGLPPLTIKLTR